MFSFTENGEKYENLDWIEDEISDDADFQFLSVTKGKYNIFENGKIRYTCTANETGEVVDGFKDAI